MSSADPVTAGDTPEQSFEQIPARASLAVSVGQTATVLQAQYLGEQGDRARAGARGVLAELRRQAGKPVEADPLSLERVLLTLSPTLSEQEIGRGDAPSASESAAFHALTLFALHMQGAAQPVHQRGVSFATACGRLYAISEAQSMKPRFDALLLARSARSQLTHARSLVSLLRANQLGFDYGSFARDLRSLTYPQQRSGVLLRWGRDFAMAPFKKGEENSQNPKTNEA